MKFDPHIHSVYSGDARSEPIDILIQAQKIGLDAIAISDHNEILGSRLARSIPGDIIVVPSIEISTEKGHMLGLGVDEIIPKGLSAKTRPAFSITSAGPASPACRTARSRWPAPAFACATSAPSARSGSMYPIDIFIASAPAMSCGRT